MLPVRASACLRRCMAGLLVAGVAWACGRSELDTLDAVDLADAGSPLAVAEASTPDVAAEAVAPAPAPPAVDPCAGAPPIPCPGGGYKYCVAGAYSDCPQRCSVCVPGSRRVCLLAYCNYWGTQTCTADGQGFGYCVEASPPPECASIADQSHSSPALEQCCLDHGYCCKDTFDLNHNGDTNEQVGQCSGVVCH